uniref:Homeodomain protein HD2 n=1 Tax=Auricularia auricula-judae TaxID=29892 RepID=A0A6M8Q7D5_AURAJ|nr:homeodomain protein HD2 [Auricularia auricula-judae]
MQIELDRCISTAQRVLTDLGVFASTLAADACTSSRRAQAQAVLTHIATSGISRIEDSRVTEPLSTKLHEATELYFQKACMALLESHASTDPLSLRTIALQLKTTYTQLYERQVVTAAKLRTKRSTPQKQPFANDILVYAFEKSQTPSKREREVLASLTGMTLEQVRVWFQNRRSRQKKKAPELQGRPALELSDVLARVKNAKIAQASQQVKSEDVFEDNDPCYISTSTLTAIPHSRVSRTISSKASTTARSYPAPYVPQPLTAESHFASPTWRRTPAQSHVSRPTVTIDELNRAMARLTLRHRLQAPRTSTTSTCSTTSTTHSSISVAAPTLASTNATKKQVVRKDGEHARKVAGGRRAAPRGSAALPSCSPAAASLQHAQGLSETVPSCLSDAPVKAQARKKAGPARRKPSTKALSRQASGASVTSVSSSSTDSSRSTSYASDFSLASVSSDFSFSSVELSPSVSGYDHLHDQNAMLQHYDSTGFASSGNQHTPVPVYDLSDMRCDFGDLTSSAHDANILLSGTSITQLLHAQQQSSPSIQPPAPTQLPVDQQFLDVGIANMGSVLDLSLTGFSTIESLLSDGATVYPNLPQPDLFFGSSEGQQCHDFNWADLSLPMAGQA